MVGIGSEVKGHVKREQMEVVAHGGRWTTVWAMERWGGGGRREWKMIRPAWRKGGRLPWVCMKPLQRGLPPWNVDPCTAPHGELAMTSLCISEEHELDVHLHPLLFQTLLLSHWLHNFAVTSAFHFVFLLDLVRWLSIPLASICLPVRSVKRDHFSMIRLLFCSISPKTISASVLCVQRLD